MGEIFNGWRRKMGVLTLGIALAFFGLWYRSHVLVDELYGRVNDGFKFFIVDGQIRVFRQYGALTPQGVAHYWTWETSKRDKNHFSIPGTLSEGRKYKASIRLPGFFFGDEKQIYLECSLSLLWIVIPLTLLSAWLLLSKPRQPSPNKVVDPAPTSGA